MMMMMMMTLWQDLGLKVNTDLFDYYKNLTKSSCCGVLLTSIFAHEIAEKSRL